MPSGYYAGLAAKIMFDAAVLYYGATSNTKIGVSVGGFTYDPGETVRHPEFDGLTTEIEGLHRFVDRKPIISGTILFSGGDIMDFLEPGNTEDSGAEGSITKTYTPLNALTLFPTGAYIKNLRMVGRQGSTYFQARFKRALCRKWNWTTPDKNEQKALVEFMGILSATDAATNTDLSPVEFNELSAAT
jgi:hypothetical protein